MFKAFCLFNLSTTTSEHSALATTTATTKPRLAPLEFIVANLSVPPHLKPAIISNFIEPTASNSCVLQPFIIDGISFHDSVSLAHKPLDGNTIQAWVLCYNTTKTPFLFAGITGDVKAIPEIRLYSFDKNWLVFELTWTFETVVGLGSQTRGLSLHVRKWSTFDYFAGRNACAAKREERPRPTNHVIGSPLAFKLLPKPSPGRSSEQCTANAFGGGLWIRKDGTPKFDGSMFSQSRLLLLDLNESKCTAESTSIGLCSRVGGNSRSLREFQYEWRPAKCILPEISPSTFISGLRQAFARRGWLAPIVQRKSKRKGSKVSEGQPGPGNLKMTFIGDSTTHYLW